MDDVVSIIYDVLYDILDILDEKDDPRIAQIRERLDQLMPSDEDQYSKAEEHFYESLGEDA